MERPGNMIIVTASSKSEWNEARRKTTRTQATFCLELVHDTVMERGRLQGESDKRRRNK